MFSNIGGKIKSLAQFICWAGIAICIYIGFNIAKDSNDVALPILIAIGGGILSWVSSFVLYGFGELIEKTTYINDGIDEIKDLIKEQTLALYDMHENGVKSEN